jgi:hypothetical protein
MTDPHAIQARACAQGITTNSAALAIKKPGVTTGIEDIRDEAP